MAGLRVGLIVSSLSEGGALDGEHGMEQVLKRVAGGICLWSGVSGNGQMGNCHDKICSI